MKWSCKLVILACVALTVRAQHDIVRAQHDICSNAANCGECLGDISRGCVWCANPLGPPGRPGQHGDKEFPRCMQPRSYRKYVSDNWMQNCGEEHIYQDTCGCADPIHPTIIKQAEECNRQGSLICGACKCYEGFGGHNCECDSYTPWGSMGVEDNLHCRAPGDQYDCSGRGTCQCGMCICEQRHNFEERIEGKHCQCTNFLCESHNGLLCSGPEHGRCDCNACECAPGWGGAACECSYSQDNCINPSSGQVCSDAGYCDCNECQCYETNDGPFIGRWCENNVRNSGPFCEDFRQCVLCRVFYKGSLTQEECNRQCYDDELIIEDGTDISIEAEEKLCMYYDEDNCQFQFAFSTVPQTRIKVASHLVCPSGVMIVNKEIIRGTNFNSKVLSFNSEVLGIPFKSEVLGTNFKSDVKDDPKVSHIEGNVMSTFYRFVKDVYDSTFAQFYKDMAKHMRRRGIF